MVCDCQTVRPGKEALWYVIARLSDQVTKHYGMGLPDWKEGSIMVCDCQTVRPGKEALWYGNARL